VATLTLLDGWSSLGYDDFLSCSSGRGLSESDIVVLLPVCDYVFYLIIRLLRVLLINSGDEVFSEGLSFGGISASSDVGLCDWFNET